MKIVLQRCKQASVTAEGRLTGSIGRGFVLLVGITHDDTEKEAEWLADKIINLRIFEDADGKMNRSLKDVNGEILSVSQFTLYADCNKGRRPSFVDAAAPDMANSMYEHFNELLRSRGVKVETGVFGAMMEVDLVNDGPVTLVLERKNEK
ncbi:D-aminoacyl-tRNA deacylase [Siminovitchia fortis]|uniref:D-aminoacyl-tRNA deacylase n=1 Tax=Siminovitchia fortis TaxID=254758 RepID=A0A443J441_9BACI|nr:D-aminoacyl-tRNA deacylase [Siminovitchia fortis]RWR15220.1 D-tyrosyl-tRNA(Tyr) deacylase [Siminovitchia fortis]WHY82638.1 D-aminoacyl-tRNA deacylase [Siminovitchia fortis]